MVDYPRVISLLSDIENPLKVTMVQREIESFSDEPFFLNLLQHALKDNTLSCMNSPHSDNLKLAASVTLNRVISDRFNELNEMQVLKILMEIILDYQIDIKAKTALETSFTTTLEFLDHCKSI
jgi:hypothetical protein